MADAQAPGFGVPNGFKADRGQVAALKGRLLEAGVKMCSVRWTSFTDSVILSRLLRRQFTCSSNATAAPVLEPGNHACRVSFVFPPVLWLVWLFPR
jgi:hypothetical protein